MCQMRAELTILNAMAAADLDEALVISCGWGLKWVDLRSQIYGKPVGALTRDDAHRARAAIDAAGVRVFCLSTAVFGGDVSAGERAFRDQLKGLRQVLAAATVLEPQVVRVLAAQLPHRRPEQEAVDVLKSRHPWLIDLYREAISLISAAGFTPAIENEAGSSFLSETADFIDFFDWLNRSDAVLTWDIGNQWETSGRIPTLADYETLRPLIGYYHLKGGLAEEGGERLEWQSSLEDSSYQVAEITQRVVDDGVASVICLNPPHGKRKPGYDYSSLTERDIKFLRTTVKGIHG